MTNKAKELLRKSEVMEVPLDLLKVDSSYQRDPKMDLVEEIAREWNVIASELILVSDRGKGPDGGLYIVNGQHRSLAAKKLGHETILARVIYLDKEKDPGAIEAGFRLDTNRRLGDRPMEKFRAKVRSGDEDSINVVRILAGFDTEINKFTVVDSGINCVSAVLSVYSVDDGALLSETLQVIHDAWGYAGGNHVNRQSLKGIAWFILQHQHEADRSRLAEKLSQQGTEQMNRRSNTMKGTMGGSMWLNYYRAIVDLYNEKLADKSRLEWRTRGSAKKFGENGADSWSNA